MSNPFQGWTQAQVDEHNRRVFDKAPSKRPNWGNLTPLSSQEISKAFAIKPKKRIRQDSKSLLNKLEMEYYNLLKLTDVKHLRLQAKRYKLANGLWYKVDFTGIIDGRETAWEVKGPHAFRGGFENLKMAASCWPEVCWRLVWKEHGHWQCQEVLP